MRYDESAWIPKVVVKTAKHFVEGKFIIDEIMPTKTVENKNFWYETPKEVVRRMAPERKELSESRIASLGEPTLTEAYCREWAFKELVTEDRIRQIGEFDAMAYVISRLSESLHLRVEYEGINALVATTCQTGSATACWDATSGQAPLDDIREAVEGLEAKGYKANTLILCPHDLRSLLNVSEIRELIVGPLVAETGLSKGAIGKLLPDLDIFVEANLQDTTPLLDDQAIVMERGIDVAPIFQSSPLASKNWLENDPEGRWIKLSRVCLPKRIQNDAIYTITNTKT